MILRDYQERIIEESRIALARSRSCIIALSTGGGKTAIASFIAKGAASRGKRVMFCCHRDFLIEQTSTAFVNVGIEHSFIASGEKYHPSVPVTIASIDTLKHRIGRYDAPNILIVDEAIHAAAAGWAKVIESFQSAGALTIGLSACPQRSDGKGLGKWFKEIIKGPSMRSLIDDGYLSDYKMYAPSGIDRAALSVRMGEFVAADAEQAMNKPHITGCAISEYRKIAAGKQAVAFCCSILHSQQVANDFRAAGFNAQHIGSDTDKSDRRSIIEAFRQGRVNVLTSVDIFSEGFDLPVVEYAALLRPTKSLNIYRQQIGRALRAADGKTYAHIADHASNHLEHGFPDDEIEWTLADREKRGKSDSEAVIAARTCPKCKFTARPTTVCRNCGYEFPIESREVEQVDGELKEVEKVAQAREKRMEVGMAKTPQDKVAIEKERGYKKGWAYRQCIFTNLIPQDMTFNNFYKEYGA